MQQAQIGGAVFDLAGTLAGLHPALPAPSLYVGSSEEGKGFALADVVGVGIVVFQQPDDAGRHIIDEYAIGYAFVGKLEHHWCGGISGDIGLVDAAVDKAEQAEAAVKAVEDHEDGGAGDAVADLCGKDAGSEQQTAEYGCGQI